jgi:hypothetical protein
MSRSTTVGPRIADLGATVFMGSPAELDKLVVEQTKRWGKVIRAANIKIEQSRLLTRHILLSTMDFSLMAHAHEKKAGRFGHKQSYLDELSVGDALQAKRSIP